MRPLKRLLFFTTCLFPVVIAHTAEPSFKEWNDVTFIERSSGELALDVIRPDDDETRPAVVCLHGGFWVKGTRKHIRPLAVDLAKLGYVGICSSYRLSGVAPFPAQIEDVRAAIRFLRENASAYGIDPERIGVVGSSAGGHLAVLAATDNRSAPAERPNAAVGMGAQTDLTAPHIQNVDSGVGAENWSKFLGGLYPEVPENYASASPLAHLSGDDPAVAIVCGELDQESTRAERFRQAAFRLGIPTALTVVPDGPHGLIHGEDHRQAAVAAIDRFFQINLGPNRHGTVPMVVQAEEGKSLGFEAVSPF
jgi:acetyl esterase/lipase